MEYFTNNFVFLLDQAYKSYLMDMHYSAVSLCGMAVERICYDLIWYPEITIGKVTLTDNQKGHFFNIPLMKLLEFLVEMNFIDQDIKKDMSKINMKRNGYVHPNLTNLKPRDDAIYCINKLCSIIDRLSKRMLSLTG